MKTCFTLLQLLEDGKHTGPENMAIDEYLSRTVKHPLLRVYEWQGSWMSLGYFGKFSQIPDGRTFVRRPTGGGIVDHEVDWTYSLIVPRGFELAEMKPSDSYRIIHESIAAFLNKSSIPCSIWTDAQSQNGDLCFRNPVTYDVMNTNGRKIAGAGQRRSKYSLLHQGSILTLEPASKLSASLLAHQLSQAVVEISADQAIPKNLQEQASTYLQPAWNQRR